MLRKVIQFIAILILLLPYNVSAMVVSPLKYRVTIEPGSSQAVFVTVSNNGNIRKYYRLFTQAVDKDENSRPIFGARKDEAEAWVKSEINSFNLAPNESRKVSYSVAVPAQAEPGSHYLGLMIEEAVNEQGQVSIGTQAAVLLQLDVAGVVQEAVSIDALSSKQFFTTKPAWDAQAKISNNGSVSVPLRTVWIVRDRQGKKLADIDAYAGNSLFPKSQRTLERSFNFSEDLRPGPYTVQLEVTYGLSRAQTIATHTMWYIPQVIIWGTGVVVLLIISFFVGRKIGKRP